jgi:hypothetical protein
VGFVLLIIVVFYNVCFALIVFIQCFVPNVASVSGLSILDCPFVLSVSLGCPFLIVPSIFSTVYCYAHLFIFLFFCVVLLCVFTFRVPCCDVRYDPCVKAMIDSALPPVVCRQEHVLFTLVVVVFAKWCQTHIVLCFCSVFFRLCILDNRQI